MNETVLIIDFGGQYKELIAKRIRELNVYSEIKSYTVTTEEVLKMNPIGIVLTGGPNSVYACDAPKCGIDFEKVGVPVLGICYGMQFLCDRYDGKVISCKTSEYGKTECLVDTSCELFMGLNKNQTVLMSHTDKVSYEFLPKDFKIAAQTDNCEVAAFYNTEKRIYGVQFHPETESTDNGLKMLSNFVKGICNAKCDYTLDNYIEEQIKLVRKAVGDKRVVLGLSGGVDSSVCAALLSRAIGDRLICIYIDHGFMRKNESDEVEKAFSDFDLNFIRVDASKRFLERVKGVTDPEVKRINIGEEFVRTFEDESAKFPDAEFLAQGTIYPDVVESGEKEESALIKSHHNVGGLPDNIRFKGVVEPLRRLFKDEVRKIGKSLGLPDSLVNRQPFPGPGLSIRVVGEITPEKLDILREADAIFRFEMEKAKIKSDQYFAVLTNNKSVGVMGDFRTYDYTVALRAVTTNDFMTCEITDIPTSVLKNVSARITNEVKGVNRVVYDVTGKPPATVEWE